MLFGVCKFDRPLSDIASIEVGVSGGEAWYESASFVQKTAAGSKYFGTHDLEYFASALYMPSVGGTVTLQYRGDTIANGGYWSGAANGIIIGVGRVTPPACTCGGGVTLGITAQALGPLRKQFHTTSQVQPPTQQEMNDGMSVPGFFDDSGGGAELHGFELPLVCNPSCNNGLLIERGAGSVVTRYRYEAGEGCTLPVSVRYASTGGGIFFNTLAPWLFSTTPGQYPQLLTKTDGAPLFVDGVAVNGDNFPSSEFTINSITIYFSQGGSITVGNSSSSSACCSGGYFYDSKAGGFVIKPLEDLLSLKFASCFGSGATGTVTAPSGSSSSGGPIISVSLTNGGTGYAKFGRIGPTVSLDGADVTVLLATSADKCNVPHWYVSGILPNVPQAPYQGTEQAKFTVAAGDTVQVPAVGTVTLERMAPTLAASATGGGAGSTFDVAIESNGDFPETWRVSGVTIEGTGSGYADGSLLKFSGPGVLFDQEATAIIRTGREEPSVSVSAVSSSGSGAAFSVTLTQTTSWSNGLPIWEVTAISIDNGGAGYAEFDYLSASPGPGGQFDWSSSPFVAYVESVDQDGAITSVALSGGGGFYKSNGVAESVELLDGGIYYAHSVAGVDLSESGKYYRESPFLPPIVSVPQVQVAQEWPSAGGGAVITAKVDSDTSSPSFGSVASIVIEKAGNGYIQRVCEFP